LVQTIPGIIILGALGSILAVIILKTLSTFVTKWLPDAHSWWRRSQNTRAIPHGFVLGRLTHEDNIPALLVYFAYRIMTFIGWLFFSAASFVVFIQLLLRVSQQSLTIGAYVFLVASMCGVWLVL